MSRRIVVKLPRPVRRRLDLAFAPAGDYLTTTARRGTVLVWDTRPEALWDESRRTGAEHEDLPLLWGALQGADAGAAYEATGRLVREKDRAVDFLAERLQPVPASTPQDIQHLIDDLDDDEFSVREHASAALARLGYTAETALRSALDQEPPIETRQRVEALLLLLSPPFESFPCEPLRVLRAVGVLEMIATEDATDLLRTLATGSPYALQTREAQAALARLEARGGK